MNSMNDQSFFDLAMKVIARQSTDAERADLESLVAAQPELKAEWERLQADTRLAKEVLPLTAAAESTAGEFPAYARGRLQTKVRQTLGRPETERKPAAANWWKWVLALATPVALVALLLVPMFSRPGTPVIQVAMLDSAGAIRGADTNETLLLQQQWPETTMQNFEKPGDLDAWEQNWPAGNKPAVKVIYDRAAGEIRVLGRWEGKPLQKTFLVERDLASALRQAEAFIREQGKH